MYVGVTSDLIRRVYEHRAKTVDGYTKRKGIDRLVYFDVIDQAPDAILYEKKLKKWKRDWKFNLIERSNPLLVGFIPAPLLTPSSDTC
ncbi:GIY-YIG nuclease family protein [Terasakiella pusilla]|uniref:GIY-YIG nuclease family protein n=1 Tax=Terasakiella pusilla TaxID=64973 RepID=UPI003AA890B0